MRISTSKKICDSGISSGEGRGVDHAGGTRQGVAVVENSEQAKMEKKALKERREAIAAARYVGSIYQFGLVRVRFLISWLCCVWLVLVWVVCLFDWPRY